MKRLNPKTNQPFKRGDVREDGKVFFNYTSIVKADGFFTERWISAKSSDRAKESDRNRKNSQYVRKTARLPNGYRKMCNYDASVIFQLKTAWRQKHELGYTDEDIRNLYEEFPEFLHLFGAEKND
jgi:hypothetical protein